MGLGLVLLLAAIAVYGAVWQQYGADAERYRLFLAGRMGTNVFYQTREKWMGAKLALDRAGFVALLLGVPGLVLVGAGVYGPLWQRDLPSSMGRVARGVGD